MGTEGSTAPPAWAKVQPALPVYREQRKWEVRVGSSQECPLKTWSKAGLQPRLLCRRMVCPVLNASRWKSRPAPSPENVEVLSRKTGKGGSNYASHPCPYSFSALSFLFSH